MKGQRERKAKIQWADRADDVKSEAQEHVAEMHNMSYSKNPHDFMVAVIDHLADKITHLEALEGEVTDTAEQVKALTESHVQQDHGLRRVEDFPTFMGSVIEHLCDQIVALQTTETAAEPEPRVNPELQLNCDDVAAFQAGMREYRLKGQEMLVVFAQIWDTIEGMLPERFSHTAYCIHVDTYAENWNDASMIAHYGSGRSGVAIRPINWDWDAAGEKEGDWYTATRDQIVEVIDQFAEFLRRLTENVTETNATVGAQLDRLQKVWERMQEVCHETETGS